MNPYTPYLHWIENQYADCLNLVKTWSNINSFTSNVEGLAAMTKQLQHDFAALEGEQTLITLAPRTVIGPGGKKTALAVGKALQIRKRPQAPIQVFLAGHMDTVYPPSSPFQTVKTLNETTWNGPGVTDMKGGLVVMLTALLALERFPLAHQIGWEVLINPDEEVGSVSSAHLFEQAAKKFHVGLIFEPAFSDGAFVNSRKGSATYTIIARGKAAHSGRDFNQGRNAIYALSQCISALEVTNHPESGFNVNVGFIEGGGPVNIVPDFALCKVNIRSNDSEKIQNYIHTLHQIADQCRQRSGIQMEVHSDTERLPKPFDKKTQILFNQIAACADELKLPFQMRESGGVCDGNILAHHGLPTIDSLGVVGGQIHTHEEFILLPSLVERAQLTLLFLLKLASKKGADLQFCNLHEEETMKKEIRLQNCRSDPFSEGEKHV